MMAVDITLVQDPPRDELLKDGRKPPLYLSVVIQQPKDHRPALCLVHEVDHVGVGVDEEPLGRLGVGEGLQLPFAYLSDGEGDMTATRRI